MKLDIFNLQNAKVGTIEVSDAVFAAEVKPHLHHEVVRWQLAKKRAGTHSTKTRSEVSGSTRKLLKQKGSGGARHGSIKSNLYPGGGVIFGPKPRDYDYALPKKVRRGALCSALSEKVAAGQLKVINGWSVETPKTRQALATLEALGANKALVVDVDNESLKLSIRNLATSKFLRSEGLNVADVIHYETVIITEAALRAIDGVLQS